MKCQWFSKVKRTGLVKASRCDSLFGETFDSFFADSYFYLTPMKYSAAAFEDCSSLEPETIDKAAERSKQPKEDNSSRRIDPKDEHNDAFCQEDNPHGLVLLVHGKA